MVWAFRNGTANHGFPSPAFTLTYICHRFTVAWSRIPVRVSQRDSEGYFNKRWSSRGASSA